MQNQLLNWTKQFADNFLINSSYIQEPGLFNGKMGAAIYLFNYFKISGNEEYEDCARELINQLFELIPSRLPLSFENGLTGIAWGIEYLAQNGFIGKEKNLILDEIDKLLFVAILKSRTLMINNGIYGAGIYFVERIKPLNVSETNLLEENKIQLASYLRDDIERLLSKNTKFAFNIPNLSLEQVNSIVYFYGELMKYKFITISTERLLDYLIMFTNNPTAKQLDRIDILTLSNLLNLISDNILDASELVRIGLILSKLQKQIPISNTTNEIVKIGWHSIIYNISNDKKLLHFP